MQDQEPLLKEIEAQALEMTRQAGEILLKHFGAVQEVTDKGKGKRDPVTEADKASQEFLKEAIMRRFPEHGIVAEEDSPEEDSPAPDYLWVLDPLDGTTNFLNGLPVYAVSVGVLYRGIPVVGCLYIPWPQQDGGLVLHARKGGGAFAGDDAIHLPDNKELEANRLTVLPAGFGTWHRFQKGMRERVGEVRTTGSIAYELALIAQGVFQYAIHTAPRIWDVAGGATVLMEAGGSVMIRPRKGRGWEALHSFFPSWSSGQTGLKEVRSWSAPLISGSPGVAEYVASSVKSRFRAGYRLARAFRRLRRSVPPN